ncbi:hypothetical protein EOD41_10705 [Mucilaginibacter limnophilus]|uniref:Uncharacterized protein n=1 Tax=Mucilaginibacter limnophilus TaxID=1932778 RepID=A0A3S3THE7_9SPHI|nr:hypothetical protein [Mucilaginibacter limnophilus]RVU01076.1 hypothetical protein EOD41_10705 [Mucilaginibacter limnophilus]
MIRIVNNAGLVLQLTPDVSVTIEKINPLFNDADKLLADVGYSFKAPFTENNLVFFNLSHLVEASTSSYTMPAKLYADEFLMVTGNIRYRVDTDGFECNLEPNVTALSTLIKTTRLTEIRGDDGDYNINTEDAMEALMLDTVEHPESYNYFYLPIWNSVFGGVEETPTFSYPSINYWNYATHKFVARRPDYISNPYAWNYAQSPFFKLKYIVKKVAEFLGLQVAGEFFTDPDIDRICIYTRRSDTEPVRFPWPAYMPNMLISEFFKQIRERLHLALDFNLSTNTLTVETFKSIYNRKDGIDLTPYILKGIEQEIPEERGYTVWLKPDEQDDAMLMETEFGSQRPPNEKLIIGDGKTEVELECTTTNMFENFYGDVALRQPFVKQGTLNWFLFAYGIPNANMNLPENERVDYANGIHYEDVNDPTSINTWPLRLLKYEGFKPIGDTGYDLPSVTNMPLDKDDEMYYRFMNDAKPLRIPAAIPPSILASYKTTDKYYFRTDGLNTIELIQQKFQLSYNNSTDRVLTKIYAKAIGFDYKTNVTVAEVADANDVLNTDENNLVPKGMYIKAYFDPDLHGITDVKVGAVTTYSDTTRPVYNEDTIKISTTPKGTGGSAIIIKAISGLPLQQHELADLKIKVYSGKPRILETNEGIRYNFQQENDYHYVILPRNSRLTRYYNYYMIYY